MNDDDRRVPGHVSAKAESHQVYAAQRQAPLVPQSAKEAGQPATHGPGIGRRSPVVARGRTPPSHHQDHVALVLVQQSVLEPFDPAFGCTLPEVMEDNL